MILSLASFAQKFDLNRKKNLFFYSLITLIPVFLVFKQPDLGSATAITVIGLAIALAAGLSVRHLVSGFLLSILLLPLSFNLLKPYQQERIKVFINPFKDPLGSGYSVIQSTVAVGSGQLWGRGLGHGTQSQLRFLPESHTDFVFASIAEELGFAGSFALLLSYFVLLNRMLVIASKSEDTFAKLIVLGVFSLITFQFTVNIGMNIGIVPITGVTLPLVSSGGSSLVASLACIGLVHSVSRKMKLQFSKNTQTIEIC